ncbi:MAG: hypothetical protein EXS31_12920 [Pedosphaera sp.]|nr:hypothetical protein [Pedosphaera sp.]
MSEPFYYERIALLALARVGGAEANEEIFVNLEKFPLASLTDAVKLQKLRVIQVAVSRNGRPEEATPMWTQCFLERSSN